MKSYFRIPRKGIDHDDGVSTSIEKMYMLNMIKGVLQNQTNSCTTNDNSTLLNKTELEELVEDIYDMDQIIYMASNSFAKFSSVFFLYF